MVHAVAHHGCGGATVAHVIEHAEVSRATFYKHFRDREACFLAAYQQIVSDLLAETRAAASGRSGDALRRVLEVLLGSLAADPEAARVVLVEAFGAGAGIRTQHDRFISAIEATVDRHLVAQGNGGLYVPATALLGGVAGTTSIRVLRGTTGGSSELIDGMVSWAESYRIPAPCPQWPPQYGRQLGEPPAAATAPPEGPRTALPRGRSALSAGEVAQMRRDRILAATARLVAAKGYERLTIADIVASAGVTRSFFYAQFGNKEEAFLAAQTVALQESIGAAAWGYFGQEEWADRIWAAGAAMLDYVARNPALAHLATVETHAAGIEALRRQHQSRLAYTLFLEDGCRLAPEPPPQIYSEMIAWAVFAMIRRRVLDRRTAEIVELLPQAAYVVLAPFIGAVEAMEFVVAKTTGGEASPLVRDIGER
jgi:AcrR family transcriptional regulator